MATNDFLPFATGGSANVLTQAQWAALGALLNGFQSGIADSKSINKAFRQSSIMSAVLAQFIADQTGVNSVDDGTTATLLANLKKATSGRFLGRQFITSSQTYTPGTYNGVTATKAHFYGQAAGGAGGGTPATNASQAAAGGGGNAGNPFDFWVTSGLVPMTVTVGAPGVGVSGSAGGNGGNLVIGPIATIPGGNGGVIGAAQAAFPTFAALGGSANTASTIATSGSIIVSGVLSGYGQQGQSSVLLSASFVQSGRGGFAPFATVGYGTSTSTNGYGAGGNGNSSGPSTAATIGFIGLPGFLIVDEYA